MDEEDWFDITKIKSAMKKAANVPIAIAFGVGAKPEDGRLAMHVKRSSEFLGKALKKEGFKSSRIIVGTAKTEGPKLIVTCEADVPKAAKAMKYFLKENKLLQKKVVLIRPAG